MQFSENKIGFSTGAISKGAFRPALDMLRDRGVRTVEISALRRDELPELIAALPTLDLSHFDYVSVHAPSRVDAGQEEQLVRELESLPPKCQWIIVHPDVILNPRTWRPIEHRIAVENMDTRKNAGRTAAEMDRVFDQVPAAKMCLDLAHSEKVDPTMYEAQTMIHRFSKRIVQVHLSEITTGSAHRRLTMQGLWAARRVAKLIPASIPVILESPVDGTNIDAEIARAKDLFHPAVADLKKDIDAVFCPPPFARTSGQKSFFSLLRQTGIPFDDAAKAIAFLPHGGPVGRGQVFVTILDLYESLAESERQQVDEYYRTAVRRVLDELPALLDSGPI